MNLWVLLILALVLLLLPAVFLPSGSGSSRSGAKPEIHGVLRPLAVLNILYCVIWHRLRINDWAPLPDQGPAILIANHTCGIDHLVLQAGSRRVLGFIIAREYYDWPLIRPFCRLIRCIPVNRDGRDLQAIRTALRALDEGRVLPIFPEGRITPESGRELGEMLPGAAYLAIRSGVPVVPAYIRGTPRTNQIAWSLITPSQARVYYGDPLDLSDIDRNQAGDKSVQAEVSRRFKQSLLDVKSRSEALDEQDMDGWVSLFSSPIESR